MFSLHYRTRITKDISHTGELKLSYGNMDNLNKDNTKEIVREISECDVGEQIQITNLTDSEHAQNLFHLLALFDTMGLLDLSRDEHDKWIVTIEHESQRYFIGSISYYLEEDLTVFRTWDEGRKDLITSANIFYGTQFLHYLERERKEAVSDPKPLRTGTVVKAIIKADFDYKECPRYLFEYDRKAEQCKLIGGLVEDPDISKKKALEREIDEEIPGVSLELGEDYYLKHLCESKSDIVSFTYGAYSLYTVHYYQVDFEENISLELTHNNKWLSLEEIRKRRTKDGNEIFPLTPEVQNLLERQPSSLEVSANFHPISFIKFYWQEIVGIITILSFIIGLLKFVL